jgi:hypothetical protein
MLRSVTGNSIGTFSEPSDFGRALRHAMSKASNIEDLFGVWEQNVATVRALTYALKQKGISQPDLAKSLVDHLKSCATALVKPSPEKAEGGATRESASEGSLSKITGGERVDKSALPIGEPKRHRSKEHLRFVASQPCLICGRKPSHAHHIRYAQSKGLALKVSDEFTVPLCALHHTENHATGDERQWWAKQRIDPLTVAQDLWMRSKDRDRNRLSVDDTTQARPGVET